MHSWVFVGASSAPYHATALESILGGMAHAGEGVVVAETADLPDRALVLRCVYHELAGAGFRCVRSHTADKRVGALSTIL